MSSPQIVELGFQSGSYTHRFVHKALYSIRNNKFIKGWCGKRGFAWGCNYRVYEGYYYLFEADGFKDERGFDFRILKIHVSKEYRFGYYNVVEEIVKTHLTLGEFKEIISDPNAPESLRLFYECLPVSYHSVGCVPDPTKTFPQDEIQRVKKFLEEKMTSLAEQ